MAYMQFFQLKFSDTKQVRLFQHIWHISKYERNTKEEESFYFGTLLSDYLQTHNLLQTF